ncbi:MAG: hypothetical protein IIX86_03320 [Clostridia bacterium]|nr:hypothetical protein [Clostridia bacterium]
MKANEFLNLMGEIDDDLIINAKNVSTPHRSPAWRKLTVIAAAACLLVGILSALVLIGMQQNVGDELPQDTEAVIESPEEDAQPEQGETVVEAETLEETTTPTPNIAIGAYLKTFSALQYGSSEASGLETDHKNNYSFYKRDYPDEFVIQSLKVNMQGSERELTYEKSSEGPLYRDTVHKYSDGVREQWFDEDMKNCVYYYNPYRPDDVDDCSKEQQMEIAYAFLESQVVNPEQYQITREEYISDTKGLYIDFTRMNNGIATCDKVTLRVNREGVITLFKLEHINEMSNVQPIPDEIIQRAYVTLDNEVQSIYRLLAEQQDYEMTYEAEIDRLVRLDDGRLALDCHVSVKVTPKEGETLSEGAWFIIPITEPTI